MDEVQGTLLSELTDEEALHMLLIGFIVIPSSVSHSECGYPVKGNELLLIRFIIFCGMVSKGSWCDNLLVHASYLASDSLIEKDNSLFMEVCGREI